MSAAFVAAPPGLDALAAGLAARLGDTLQAVIGFGSVLSPRLQKKGSIPDLLAVVDDVDDALRRLGEGRLVRALARVLPPIVVAYARGRGPALAKLNVVAADVAAREVEGGRDLYLAGRLSKPVALLWVRDAGAERAALDLHGMAIRRIAAETVLGLAGDAPLADVVTAAIALSYRAELRPEGGDKFTAIAAAFPEFYGQTLPALLREAAARRGFAVAGGVCRDVRAAATRAAHRGHARRLLRRSRLRVAARLLRQLVVYRGALAYVRGKLRRLRSR